MSPHRIAAVVASALLLTGCDDDGTSPEPCTAATAEVDASISTGNQVVFDWEPACGMVLLLIEEGASDRWSIHDPGEDDNTIEPPVTYGVVPSGAEEGRAPEDLEPGTTYELVLWRLDPDTGAGILMAVEEFTP